ncbi:MAG: preprotein translocase subunit SecE [Deltaproteobacteria bacterium]|nr:preprotein translocase subunit SecE [Deltaproteobacteria bacterium]
MEQAPSIGSKMEPKRMVGIALFALAIAGGMFIDRVAKALFAALKWNDPALFGIDDLTLTGVIGFAIAVGVAIYLYMNARTREGGLEIAAELKRVTWPSLAETRVSTIAVIIASLVSSLILAFFDIVASKVMTTWVPAALRWATGA